MSCTRGLLYSGRVATARFASSRTQPTLYPYLGHAPNAIQLSSMIYRAVLPRRVAPTNDLPAARTLFWRGSAGWIFCKQNLVTGIQPLDRLKLLLRSRVGDGSINVTRLSRDPSPVLLPCRTFSLFFHSSSEYGLLLNNSYGIHTN